MISGAIMQARNRRKAAEAEVVLQQAMQARGRVAERAKAPTAAPFSHPGQTPKEAKSEVSYIAIGAALLVGMIIG